MSDLRSCNVCSERIVNVAEGYIDGGTFGDSLRRLYRDQLEADGLGEPDWNRIDAGACQRLRYGPHGKFVDAVSHCYLVQFRDFYQPKDDRIVDNSETVAFIELLGSPGRRLPLVLQAFPEDKDLWLLAHLACIPDELDGHYPIPLERINTGEKAIEWTIQLSTNAQWNPLGWVYVLENLFGRVPA